MFRESLKKSLRITALIQVVSTAIVLLITWWIFGVLDLFILGTAYTWVGVIILLIAVFFGVGGFFSKGEDIKAFSLSGAGKMDTHFKNVREASSPRLIFIMVGILNGVIPILVGYVLQRLGS